MILLSFDTEEFDVPREHGVDFPLDEAMKVSVYGTNRILDCLKNNGKSTPCSRGTSNSSVSKLNNIIAISRITTAAYHADVYSNRLTL